MGKLTAGICVFISGISCASYDQVMKSGRCDVDNDNAYKACSQYRGIKDGEWKDGEWIGTRPSMCSICSDELIAYQRQESSVYEPTSACTPQAEAFHGCAS